MVLSVSSMINTINSIDGINLTNINFFESFFGTLALEMNVKYRGNSLSFSSTRISEVTRGKDNLYKCIAELAGNPKTREILLKATRKTKEDLFCGVSLATINEKLRELTVDDQTFMDEIMNSACNDDEDEIFVGYIRSAMKYELDARKAKKQHKIASGNFVTKKSNATIISELIDELIRNNGSMNEWVKPEQKYRLEEKMSFNNFNKPLKGQIRNAFDDYENVITSIDHLSVKNSQVQKTLNSTYKNAYIHVLSNLFGNDYEDDDIRKSSSFIFQKVNDYIYNDTLKGKLKANIEEDLVKYNLFCITVCVFYKSEFMLENEDDNICCQQQ